MTLILVLLALFIVKFTGFFHAVRADMRLVHYIDSLIPKIAVNPYMLVLAVLFLFAAIIAIIQFLLMSFAFGLFGCLFSVLLLVYCLEEVTLGEKGVPVFYQAVLQGLFSVIFWFVLFGPAGCLVYRLSQRLSVSSEDPLARRFSLWLVYVLDWIPARLLALTFSFSSWRQVFNTRFADSYDILYRCGSMDDAQALVNRAWFIWLAVLALVFIF